MKNSGIFLIVVGLCSIGLYKGIDIYESELSTLPVFGDANHSIEEFELYNQLNGTFNSNEHAGKIWVVHYFFTSCPSICPKMIKNMQTVHELLRNEERLIFLSLTVDPKRDTPERLKAYSEKYNVNHDSWHFLTGSKKQLYRLARNSFLVSASEGSGDEYDFIHSENIVIIDQQQQIRSIIDGTLKTAPDEILGVIKKLM